MRKNRIVWGFAVLALAAGLVCMSGSEAFAGKKTPPPYNVLYSFTGGTTDGQYPYGNGLVGSGATLYGMTYYGGSDADTNGYGTIFEVNTLTGKETVLHSFAGGTTDGEYPYGSLTLSGKILYGMTYEGGTNGGGTIFEYNITTKVYEVLYNFAGGTTDGGYPYGSLTLSGNTLYGMTYGGGNDLDGTIFAYNIETKKETLLHSFDYYDGEDPYGNLVVSSGNLYGMTEDGGSLGHGNIFMINIKTQELTELYSFTGDGGSPYGSLVVSGKNLYGMTYAGGEYGYGLIFMLNTANGELTELHSFAGGTTDGAYPYYGNNLVMSGQNLYGIVYEGGTNNDGVIFELNPATGVFTLLHSFGSGTDGYDPYGGLTLSGTTLYGMTYHGGANSVGTIFSYSLK